MKVYLSKNIIQNSEISDDAILTYVALRIIQKDYNSGGMYFTFEEMYYYLTNNFVPSRSFKKSLDRGLLELEEYTLIKLIYLYKNNERIYNVDDLYVNIQEEGFIIVETDEISNILNNSGNKNSIKVLRYYLCILSTFFKNKDFGVSYSQSTQKKLAEISNATKINSYNNLLERLKILFIYHYNTMSFDYKENNIIRLPNIMSRYCDRDKIISIALKLKTEFEKQNPNSYISQIKYKQSAQNRSMSQKYARLLKGYKYSYDELKEIYNGVIEINKAYRERYFTDEAYDKAKKDLSVFKDYDFYDDNDEL